MNHWMNREHADAVSLIYNLSSQLFKPSYPIYWTRLRLLAQEQPGIVTYGKCRILSRGLGSTSGGHRGLAHSNSELEIVACQWTQ